MSFIDCLHIVPYHTLMNSISIQIPLKPISINHSHKSVMSKWRNPKTGKHRIMRVKTNETNTFETMFNHFLKQVHSDLANWRNDYNPHTHAIHLDAYFYINEKDFFTKAKSIKNPRIEISKNSLDLDNCLKICIDVMCNYMDLNDKAITYINAQKVPTSGEDQMIFKFSYAPWPTLGDFSAEHLYNL